MVPHFHTPPWAHHHRFHPQACSCLGPTSLRGGAICKSCVRDEETHFGEAERTKTRIGGTGLVFHSLCDERILSGWETWEH